MKILFLGDVMGRAGREAVISKLPDIRRRYAPDFIIVNVENASGGRGVTAVHAAEFLAAGADVLTLGDHAFDQKDIFAALEEERRIIRPLNIARTAPGRGVGVFTGRGGHRVMVAQALGQTFMKNPYADPFSALDTALRDKPLGRSVDAVFVDFHAEATSEKMAMGLWLDGRISGLAGTHTHVPTGDCMILSNGAAYMTDAGMCGDYHSVIGMDAAEPIRRFVTGMSKGRMTPAMGDVTLSGLWFETDKAGKSVRAMPFRMGGHLAPSLPPEHTR